MRFNYSKLRGKIKECFDTQSRFAKKVGISERALSMKLNNLSCFTQEEMLKIIQHLNIQSEEISDYFFRIKD